MKPTKKALELKDVVNFQQLVNFVNSKSSLSPKGCIEIIGRAVQMAMQVSGQKQVSLMFSAYCVNREGTKEELSKQFSEWLAKINAQPEVKKEDSTVEVEKKKE